MKYAWIAKHKAYWPITVACAALGVSASGYFEHQGKKSAARPPEFDTKTPKSAIFEMAPQQNQQLSCAVQKLV